MVALPRARSVKNAKPLAEFSWEVKTTAAHPDACIGVRRCRLTKMERGN